MAARRTPKPRKSVASPELGLRPVSPVQTLERPAELPRIAGPPSWLLRVADEYEALLAIRPRIEQRVLRGAKERLGRYIGAGAYDMLNEMREHGFAVADFDLILLAVWHLCHPIDPIVDWPNPYRGCFARLSAVGLSCEYGHSHCIRRSDQAGR